MMTAPITRDAGRFAAEISFADLPPKAVEIARLGFADTLAALLAGLREPVTEKVEAYARQEVGVGTIPYLLGRGRSSAEWAALIDATSAHSLDFDDYVFANHFSAVLVPVIMATGHLAGESATGKRMATAYAAAYEVWADVMVREPDHLHSKGWHPTAVFGPVGAAVAASHMLALSADEATNAIALSVSHAGGVMANFGAMSKPYHAGRAAAAGVRSALLTRLGLTAQPNAIEDSRGLLAALSPAGHCDLDTPTAYGTLWRVEKSGLNIKKHPTVGASQRVVDAVLALLQIQPVPLDRIRSIVPRVSKKHAAVMTFHEPKSPSEAKFSLEYATSAALLYGRVGLSDMTQENLDSREIRRLMGMVRIDAVDDYDPDYPVAAPFDIVTIGLDDGSEIVTPKIRRAAGHADVPLDMDQHWKKFADCADFGGVDKARARELFDKTQMLETLGHVSAFSLQ